MLTSIVAGLSLPRDHDDCDPGNQALRQSATKSVQLGTTNSHKQGESRSIEEASSFPGLNEDSTEQKLLETLSGPTSAEDGYKMSTSEHGIDLLSEGIRASIRSLEERVKQLEDGKAQPPRLEVDLDAPNNQVHSSDTLGNVPLPTRIIPQMKYVGWHEFKNKLVNRQEAYAIEVLVGEAKLYYQQAEEEKKDKVKDGLHGHNQRAKLLIKLDGEACASEPSTPKEVPERIRINSTILSNILQGISHEILGRPLVILRPFKVLVYYDAQIRERYHRLEAKWGECESGIALGHGGLGVAKAADQVRDEAEPRKPLDSPLAAKDEVSLQNQTTEFSTARRESAFGQGRGLSTEVPAEVKEDRCLEGSPVESASHSTIGTGNSSPKENPVLNEETKKGAESKDLTDSVEAFRELRCLIDFIDDELKPVMEDFEAGRRKKVWFSDLWYLFRPGDLLYTPLVNNAVIDVARSLDDYGDDDLSVTKKTGARFQEVWRIDATADGRPNLRERSRGRREREGRERDGRESMAEKVNKFLLHGYHVDLNYMHAYETFMYKFRIEPFPGQRDISSLPFYPLKYLANADRLCSKWKTRGDAFREFHTFAHKYYIGRTLTSYPNGDSPRHDDLPKHAENIDSHVVVHFREALTANSRWQSHQDTDPPLLPTSAELEEDYHTKYWEDTNCKEPYTSLEDYIFFDGHIDSALSAEQRSKDTLMGNRRAKNLTEHSELSDEHLMLLPNRVFAFVLRNRKFGNVPIH